ncbi:MAG: arsenic efflux protein [Clostridia bacterium]|nr:arsenic efflux protein [Clostridia bacterium]
MEVLLDALKDTLIVFPFILIIYMLIELLENGTTAAKSRRALQGPLAPLIGSATGLVPQCGFSVMAARLYDSGLIRTGTIMAVFLATSDEALIILLVNSPLSAQAAQSILPLILIKLLVAVSAGYLINLIIPDRHADVQPLYGNSGEITSYSCGHDHAGKSSVRLYIVEPLLHALKVTAFILIVNLVLGFIIAEVGEETIAKGLIGGAYIQPFITAAVGLIPNCASSTVITETFVKGGITFGSCIAGLCTNAGLGLVVLLKNTKKIKRNILLVISLYAIAVIVGIVINVIYAAIGL